MAGNQNRDWIRAARAAHGTNGLRSANGAGNFTVTFGLATADFAQRTPDALLKFRFAGPIERRQCFSRAPGKNRPQRGFGRAMPAAYFGRDIALRCPDAAARRPYPREVQFSQSFFRIACDKLTGVGGNGQFNRTFFKTVAADVLVAPKLCEGGRRLTLKSELEWSLVTSAVTGF